MSTHGLSHNKAMHGDYFSVAASPSLQSRRVLVTLRGNMFRSRAKKFKLIPVLPKNYRSIFLYAIEVYSAPRVFMDKQVVTDFSEQGKLTHNGIKGCTNFEICDGNVGILGFHDRPSEMWVNENYLGFARYCEQKGWLSIEGSAS